MTPYTLHQGDCRDVMAGMEADSVDAIVCDPPYGLRFMGKGWDHGVPGVEFWQAAKRVAKPGAHLLAFGGTRTFHRLTVAIEDAGWEIRDTIMWVYGSGFPKSLDVSKAIDAAAGAEREVVGSKHLTGMTATRETFGADDRSGGKGMGFRAGDIALTAPATPEAQRWQGWGTALKPAWEPVIVARKPLAGVASNVLRYGTGGINVDACRIGHDEPEKLTTRTAPKFNGNVWAQDAYSLQMDAGNRASPDPLGRWPANLIHDGSEDVVSLFPEARSAGDYPSAARSGHVTTYEWDHHQGALYSDSGSAARFFYTAKASREDREEGLESLPLRSAGEATDRVDGSAGLNSPRAGASRTNGARNHHPTVKPTSLMRYLCRLVTPRDGIVLDPFMGSGSTGKAAILEGFRFVGIDLEPEYVEIARARCEWAMAQPRQLALEGTE